MTGLRAFLRSDFAAGLVAGSLLTAAVMDVDSPTWWRLAVALMAVASITTHVWMQQRVQP